MEDVFSVSGNIVDVLNRRIFAGTLHIERGRIVHIQEDNTIYGQFICPGFIDAHVHVESSLLTPAEFAKLAVVHGTVATISDPHEIANVLGIAGVEFMLENARQVPFKFFFGAPSCVPATRFETAGAVLDVQAVEQLLQRKDIWYLSEMMNFPGVLQQDPDVMGKIALARQYGKPVDGHAPGLRGEQARRYAEAGISTDHECTTLEEAQDKLHAGMHILIREGSAARNFDALIPLLKTFPERIMFCSDDKHPDSLVAGHINELVKRALTKGQALFDVLGAACLNPIQHYHLPVGRLQIGDPADFIVVDNFERLHILATYVEGKLVAREGKSLIPSVSSPTPNHFHSPKLKQEDLEVKAPTGSPCFIRIIEAIDGQIVTGAAQALARIHDGKIVSDTQQDILKLVVINRYKAARPAIAFIRGFGLKRGAIASSVAHDSHNLIAVGVNDEMILKAIQAIVPHGGGLSVVHEHKQLVLPLPVAGLMSAEDGYAVARKYEQLDAEAKALGSKLRAPFMTLSFMALLVIPRLKLSDQGLFDVEQFGFTHLFI
ncbi:adenine deaminase [Thermoflavifilum thermophilum]|uniref:Adenine deaminase n=1 Tax=Thermoflavifilum thermophilum TaxID=1393122 RepID=A0A1I7N5W5_9BACT|nr:adenine deaminase [Thermoflavifilum thermophilum]SFV30031.1 Adenine deaminase [Thermoflavifilum thermophilum]